MVTDNYYERKNELEISHKEVDNITTKNIE